MTKAIPKQDAERELLLSVPDMARELGVVPNTIKNWIDRLALQPAARSRLMHFYPPGTVQVIREAIEAYRSRASANAGQVEG